MKELFSEVQKLFNEFSDLKGNVEKLPDLPKVPSLLSPDFKDKRAHADAKFNAFEKGFELAEKKSEKEGEGCFKIYCF